MISVILRSACTHLLCAINMPVLKPNKLIKKSSPPPLGALTPSSFTQGSVTQYGQNPKYPAESVRSQVKI